jgi:hypothetical protein
MLKHINEPPPDIFQRTGIRVPVGIQEAIEKLLAKDPARRPPNCEEVKRLVQAALKTPLIGPIDAMTDKVPPRRLEGARAGNHEATGLASAVPAPTTTDRAAIVSSDSARGATASKGKAGRMAIAAVAVVGIGLAAAFGSGMFGSESAPVVAPVVEAATATSDPQPGASAAPSEAVHAGATEPGTTAGAAPVEPAGHVAVADASPTVAETPPAADVAPETNAKVPEAPAVVPPTEVKAPEPQPEAMTRFKLDTVPSGASVFEGDVLLGNTPLEFSRRKNSDTVRLVLKLKGFVDKPVALGTVADAITETYPLQAVRRTNGTGSLGGPKPGGSFGTF